MNQAWTYRIRQGGLMRCCIQSIDNAMLARWEANEGPPAEGDKVKCEHCRDGAIFRDGAWEWDR